MPFDSAPAVPWDVDHDLDERVELRLNKAWVDVTPYVFENTTVIGRGQPDESKNAVASTLSGRLANGDGRFTDLNPSGPYYPYLTLNTPVRVSAPYGCGYLRLQDDDGNVAHVGAQCPSSSAMNAIFAGGFDLQVDADLDNWQAGQTIISKWGVTGNQRSWMLNTLDGGGVQLLIATAGTFTGLGVDVHFMNFKAPPIAPHGRASLRVVYNATTGVGTLYTGTLCANWTQVDQLTFSTPRMPFSSTFRVEVGTCTQSDLEGSSVVPDVGAAWGKAFAVRMLDVTGSTVALIPDFTTQSEASDSFSDGTNAWACINGAHFSTRDYRFHGVADQWPQTWSPGEKNAAVSFTAAGLLRRMGSSSASIQSAMRRAYTRVTGTGLVYYAPMEDSGGTRFGPGIPGIDGGAISGTPQFASFSGFKSSAPLPVTNSAQYTFPMPTLYPKGNSIVRFLMSIPAATEPNGVIIASVYFDASSTIGRVDLSYGTGGSLTLTGYAGSNGTQAWTTGPFGFAVDGADLRASIEVLNVTGSTYSAAVSTVNADTGWSGWAFGAGSFGSGISGQQGRVTKVVLNPAGGSQLTQTAFGHLSVETVATSNPAMQQPLQAWAGELAGARIRRLCLEEGIPYRLVGDLFKTVAMGPQTMQAIAALLQECASTDKGMLFEPRQVLGFAYRTRASISNQLVGLGLDYNQEHLSDDLSPTRDAQNVKNDITTTNSATGSQSRQALDDGSPMSVGAIGRYDAQDQVNLAHDDMTDDLAGWQLRMGTINEARYTAINVDLGNREMAPLWRQAADLDVGDRVNIFSPPPFVAPGLIDQLVLGAKERVSRKDFAFAWNTQPHAPWDTGLVEDPVYGRVDTDNSYVGAQASAPLGPDGFFSAGALAGWAAFNGALAIDASVASTACPMPGKYAARFTVSGTSGGAIEGSPSPFAVSPNAPVRASAMVRVPVACTISVGVDWLTSGGSFVSTSVTSFAVPANAWTPIATPSFLPPATAAKAYARCGPVSGSPNGTVAYVKGLLAWAGGFFFQTQDGLPEWTTDSAQYPFDLAVAGEKVTALSCALAGSLANLDGPDGTFESGVSQWACSGGSLAQSSAHFHAGAFAALCTVSGSPTQMTLRPSSPGSLVPVGQAELSIGGMIYTAAMAVFSTGALTVTPVIDWRDAAGTLVSSTLGTPVAILANTWTNLSVSGIPPAGATLAGYGPTLGGSPANGTQLWVDDCHLQTFGQAVVVCRGVNGVLKAQPPGGDVRLFYPTIIGL